MAFLANDSLGLLVLKFLALAGGVGIGAVSTGALAQFLVRKLTRRSTPMIKSLARLLGGIGGGVLTAILIFGGAGAGWGLGGWGFGGGHGNAGSATTRSASSALEQPQTPAATQAEPPGVRSLRIIMLGGDLIRDGAAYRIEGESQSRTLADLKQVLRRRMDAKPALQSLDVLIYTNSLARNTSPVFDLETWARQSGLTVRTIEAPGEIPK